MVLKEKNLSLMPLFQKGKETKYYYDLPVSRAVKQFISTDITILLILILISGYYAFVDEECNSYSVMYSCSLYEKFKKRQLIILLVTEAAIAFGVLAVKAILCFNMAGGDRVVEKLYNTYGFYSTATGMNALSVMISTFVIKLFLLVLAGAFTLLVSVYTKKQYVCSFISALISVIVSYEYKEYLSEAVIEGHFVPGLIVAFIILAVVCVWYQERLKKLFLK